MAAKYREGRLTLVAARLADTAATPIKNYCSALNAFDVQGALAAAVSIAADANGLVEASAPWKLAKNPEQADKLDAVLYSLSETLRIIAILISPVLPKAAAAIFLQLNWDGPMTLAEATWGKLPDGHILGTPVPIFPRILPPLGA